MAWLVVASTLVVNGVVDAERDKQKWPLRPLASGLISKSEGMLYSIILAGPAFAIALVVFNWLSAAITFFIFILGYIYARYTRDGIGYLTVIVPVALIPYSLGCNLPRDHLNPGTMAAGCVLRSLRNGGKHR